MKDFETLQTTVEEYLGEFNGESKQPMHLVMFGDAIEHVSRISRVIRCVTSAQEVTKPDLCKGTPLF